MANSSQDVASSPSVLIQPPQATPSTPGRNSRMGRLADVVYIGFAVRPEWNPTIPLKLEDISIVPTVSRQVEQMDGWADVVKKIEDIIRREIALPHILQFRTKLEQITPPPGYALDDATRNSIHFPLRLDTGVGSIANAPTPTASVAPTPTTSSRIPSRSTLPAHTRSTASTPAAGPSQSRSLSQPLGSSSTGNHSARHRPGVLPASLNTVPSPSSASRHRGASSISVPSLPSTYRSSGRGQLGTTCRTARARPAVAETEPIEILSSSEEQEDGPAAPSVQVPRTSRPQRRSSHWLHTPPGFPPCNPPPAATPPSYYTDPDVNAFCFPPAVARFLRETVSADGRTLCIIDATRNCERSAWPVHFCEAGLFSSHAETLEELLVAALPVDLRLALTASSAPSVSPTSLGTSESSIIPDASDGENEEDDPYWRGLAEDEEDTYCASAYSQEPTYHSTSPATRPPARMDTPNTTQPPGPTPKRAKRTKEQIAAGKENTTQMWEDVYEKRNEYKQMVHSLAEKHGTSVSWMATQMYGSSIFSKTTKKTQLFNAVLHDRTLEARGADGKLPGGKAVLGILSKEISLNTSWRDLSEEEQLRLIKQLDDPKASQKKVEKVLPAHQGNDIERTMTGINTEVKEACLSLFKCTPDQMVLQVEAFITSGLSGTIKLAGKKQPDQLRGEIRKRVLEGLQEVVQRKNELEGNPDAVFPGAMNYDNYEDRIVCQWGVELVGWTEGSIVNPRLITATLALCRLLIAIDTKDCHWTILSPEDLAVRCAQRDERIREGKVKARKRRSDAGMSKKVAGKKRSADEVDSDSSSDRG
ncbi:hypothetical protein HWV62_16878 [Athelia sp. TMB]|nr:hypothetical protein HWV62_16878 [Athelia sp. TMB]